MCYEGKEVNNDAVDEGRGWGSSEEDMNEVTQDVNTGPSGAAEVHDGSQILQQQPQGTVHWERFLPVRSLKVLLVEYDDSTRHVVTALLRNCCYEVVPVSNGLQAWKILQDADNHIDVVLTEVVMPLFSGINLLCKIMSHQTFKNIPVIMMSSHDSMSTVFKCLSKGAVDFLVKPIRKNELKNLWQHVWRRCHSSSGSGSESGTQTKKYVKSKSNYESENNTGSSDEHDNRSNGLSIRDGSDNGSGTQSSWTKRAAEDDSPLPTSPHAQLVDAPDSTCAQVIHTKPEKNSNMLHATETKECLEKDEQLDNVAMGKDLEIGLSRSLDLQYEFQQENFSVHPTSKRQSKLPAIGGKPFDNGQLEHSGENLIGKPRNQSPNPQAESRNIDIASSLSDIPHTKEGCSSEPLSLELTLKRLKGVGDVGKIANEDRNILRHSDLSAFSRYISVSSANQAPTGNAISCSPLINSSVAPNTVTIHNVPSLSSGTPSSQKPNESACNNDMISTSNYITLKPEAFNEKPESTSAFIPFHSVCSAQEVPIKGDDAEMNKVQVQHHHHHHHYYHHVHSMQQHKRETENDDLSMNDLAATAQQCGSSNVFGGNIESNAGNYSVNGSASGSNYLSSGQNGSSTAVNAGATNVESDYGVGGNSGRGGSGADKGWVAQREAALNKFRQKRKERCFEKKVRYHSRKKLAEQRPRIRGQFVRQIESNSKEEKERQNKNVASEHNSCDSEQ